MIRPRRTLVVMVKEPRPGRVKTRLGADIGLIPAAWWFRHQTRALLRRLDDPRWQLVLAVSPEIQGLNSRIWPKHLEKRRQGGGDLGARMKRQMQGAAPGPVCIIGADIPGIARHHVYRAFRQLGQTDAVLGPAADGGYWLVGVRRPESLPPSLFTDVRWSTSHAMADTVRSFGDRTIGFVDTLRDVDRASDL